MTRELLEQMDAQHHLRGKRRPACLTYRRVRCDQRQQARPRDHLAHLIQKLMHALGEKLVSGGCEAYLLHASNGSDQAALGLAFADVP